MYVYTPVQHVWDTHMLHSYGRVAPHLQQCDLLSALKGVIEAVKPVNHVSYL